MPLLDGEEASRPRGAAEVMPFSSPLPSSLSVVRDALVCFSGCDGPSTVSPAASLAELVAAAKFLVAAAASTGAAGALVSAPAADSPSLPAGFSGSALPSATTALCGRLRGVLDETVLLCCRASGRNGGEGVLRSPVAPVPSGARTVLSGGAALGKAAPAATPPALPASVAGDVCCERTMLFCMSSRRWRSASGPTKSKEALPENWWVRSKLLWSQLCSRGETPPRGRAASAAPSSRTRVGSRCELLVRGG